MKKMLKFSRVMSSKMRKTHFNDTFIWRVVGSKRTLFIKVRKTYLNDTYGELSDPNGLGDFHRNYKLA